jgi:hypothetical protein
MSPFNARLGATHRPFNSSYNPSLGVLHGREGISGQFKFKTPQFWTVVVVKTSVTEGLTLV